MKVFLSSKKKAFSATGEYNPSTNEVTVKKGSILSASISGSQTFRSRKSVEKQREGIVKNNVLQKDMSFNSPSSAANFVTGSSTNGIRVWKTQDGKTIKELLEEK